MTMISCIENGALFMLCGNRHPYIHLSTLLHLNPHIRLLYKVSAGLAMLENMLPFIRTPGNLFSSSFMAEFERNPKICRVFKLFKEDNNLQKEISFKEVMQ